MIYKVLLSSEYVVMGQSEVHYNRCLINHPGHFLFFILIYWTCSPLQQLHVCFDISPLIQLNHTKDYFKCWVTVQNGHEWGRPPRHLPVLWRGVRLPLWKWERSVTVSHLVRNLILVSLDHKTLWRFDIRVSEMPSGKLQLRVKAILLLTGEDSSQ